MSTQSLLHTLPVVLLSLVTTTVTAQEEQVDYARQILPLLSDTCFQCHGPDANTREADLRLDTVEGLFGTDTYAGVVVGGDVDSSELMRRILSEDPGERMPPEDSTRQLTADQIETLRVWVEQGAPWGKHWSYELIESPPSPAPDVTRTTDDFTSFELQSWADSPIDRFVLERMLAEGLYPADDADRERLLRRVTFDLTGLAPTLDELDRFLNDDSPDAYEKVVDRLLASPRYGERMAWDWLDAARYADSNGFQGDRERTMWPWRDWVIRSLNEDLPYDQFSVFQIAGDLLPKATFEQKLATGFSRNHMINGEGGRIPEENRVEYIFDQLETVGTVWMGLTYQCCRCHDHKYDQLSQDNYYELFAIFNQTPITGAGGDPQTQPAITAPSANQQRALNERQYKLASLGEKIAQRGLELESEQLDWERRLRDMLATADWHLSSPTEATASKQTLTTLLDGSVLAGGDVQPDNDTFTVRYRDLPDTIHGIHLEALQHKSLPGKGLSRVDGGNFVLTELEVDLLVEGNEPTRIELASAEATFEQGDLKVVTAFDGNPNTGWAVWPGKPVEEEQAAVFRFAKPLQIPQGGQLLITLRHDSQHARHILGCFRIAFATTSDPQIAPDTIAGLAATRIPADERSEEALAQLRKLHLNSDERYRELTAQRERLRSEEERIRSGLARVMIMKDREERRPTYVLSKGLYNQPQHEVEAKLLDLFPYQSESGPIDRLELANWIVDPRNPLTARVTANRIWQQFFGQGLVRTPEDFGVQGERPTHPELLDWLSAELIDNGWDLKSLQKTIVTSRTYRQSAQVSERAAEYDPANRWLSHGPRQRMPSWMIRDAALQISGLWAEEIGGPSVRPYQPDGVWADATFGKKRYQQDHGAGLYRRSLYTFWRRIIGPTMFFDVAKRQTCSVVPQLTNTPLHALVTLNDVTFVEAARVMAQHLLVQEDRSRDDRLVEAFRRSTSRHPSRRELEILESRLERFSAYYREHEQDAESLLAIGEFPRDEDLDPARHAAWTSLCQMILNLDESLSK